MISYSDHSEWVYSVGIDDAIKLRHQASLGICPVPLSGGLGARLLGLTGSMSGKKRTEKKLPIRREEGKKEKRPEANRTELC